MNPTSFKAAVDAVFLWALQTSFYATALIALVLLVQFVFRRKLPARWRYALGLLVMARLALPFAPASSLSIFNLAKHSPPPLAPRQMEIAALMTEPTPMESPVELVPDAGELTPGGWVPERPPRFKIGSLAGMAWLAGCLTMLAVAGRRYFSFKSASGSWGAVTEPRVLELLGECKARLGVGRNLRVLNAPGLDTPALFGHWRPVLLLPAEISQRLGDRELRHILLHELVHLKRGDVLVNWAMIVVRALHWFNPMVWIAFRRLRADQELACDAAVMQVLAPDERRDYGNTLIRVLEEFSVVRPCPGMVPLVPFFSRKQTIQRRIVMIANFKPAGRVAAVASIALLIALGCLTFTRAAEKRTAAAASGLTPMVDSAQPNTVATGDPQSASQRDTIDRFTKEIADVEDQIKRQTENLAVLREKLGIPWSVAEGRSPLEEAGVIARLLGLKIAAENEIVKDEVILGHLKTFDEAKRRDTLPRVFPDPMLSSLLQDLQATETKLTSIKLDLGESHPDVVRTEAVRKSLDDKVSSQVNAIMAALQTKLDSLKAQADSATERLRAAKTDDNEKTHQNRAYWEAKDNLERLQRLRDIIYLRISQEIVEAGAPTGGNSRRNMSGLPVEVAANYDRARANFDKAVAEYERTMATYPPESPLVDGTKRRVDESRAALKQIEDLYPVLKSNSSQTAPVSVPIVVTIQKDGQVRMESEKGTSIFSGAQITIPLRDATAKGSRVSMIIEADKDTKLDSLKEVIDAAQAAGIGSITLRGASPK